MSFRDFLLDKVAPTWRKYGAWIAGAIVLGLLLLWVFVHTDKSSIPQDIIEEDLEGPSKMPRRFVTDGGIGR